MPNPKAWEAIRYLEFMLLSKADLTARGLCASLRNETLGPKPSLGRVAGLTMTSGEPSLNLGTGHACTLCPQLRPY